MTNREKIRNRLHDGDLVVGCTFEVAVYNASLTPAQGFFCELFANASASEYALFALIAADAPY